MIGLVEACHHSGATLLDLIQKPETLKAPHSSKKTELVLQTASRIAFSENDINPCSEKFRRISNLIFAANEYWDIGLRVREEICKNKAYKFVALNTLLGDTISSLKNNQEIFTSKYPQLSELTTTFIHDGEILAINNKKFSGVQYREIDSGISALFTFKSICKENYLENLGLYPSEKCQTSTDLLDKYKYFLVNQLDIGNLDIDLKKIVGLQAIEMMVACQDDRWGVNEDSILKIPNTMENGLAENKKLFNSYKKKAVECGFSRVIPEILSYFSIVHRLNSKKIKNLNTIELSEIQKYRNLGNIHYLREWLYSSSLLDSLFS